MAALRPYLLSFGVGLLVGVIYAALKVRSPAPPIIALVGLLGILVGEQVVPLATAARGQAAETLKACRAHVFGMLPGHDRHAGPGGDRDA